MRYTEELFQNVNVQEDIHFATVQNHRGETVDLGMDIYSPAEDTETKRRCMILIHGGGFRVGCDKQQRYIVEIAKWLARRGYVVVSPDYTLYELNEERPDSNLAGAEAARQCDLCRVYVLEHADELGIDPENLAIGGGSAGGMTANCMCRLPNSYRVLINLWGSPFTPMQLETYPPTLTVHGTKDPSVPFDNSIRLQEQLNAAGIVNDLFPVEGGGHTPMHAADAFLPVVLEFMDRCFTAEA